MNDNQNINRISENERKLNRRDINTVIEIANKFNKVSAGGDGLEYFSEDGFSRSSLSSTPYPKKFPFRLNMRTGTELEITKGSWIRGNTEVELSDGGLGSEDSNDSDVILVNTNEFLPSLAVGTYYVYVELVQDLLETTYKFEPSIIPGNLYVGVTSVKEDAGLLDPDYISVEGGDTQDTKTFFKKNKEVIGTLIIISNGSSGFIVKKIVQERSDDINDQNFIPDSSAEDTTTSFRKTIENNPIVSGTADPLHFGEGQIANVNYVAGSGTYSHAIFNSTSNNWTKVGPAGEMKWIAIDSRYVPQDPPVINTLQVINDGANNDANGTPFKIETLYGATTTLINSKSMCYYDATTIKGGNTQGTLRWCVVDSHYVASGYPKQFSLEILGANSYFQLWDFDSPSNNSPDYQSLILFRHTTGAGNNILRYCDADNLGDWLRDNWGGWDYSISYEINYWWNNNAYHDGLIDVAAGNLVDHDHGNYWQNVDSVAGAYGAAGTTYLVNNGTSIGTSGKILAIHLDNRTLDASTGVTVNWESRSLGGGTDWSVNNGTIFKILDVTEAGSGTGALVISGGASIAKGINVAANSSGISILATTGYVEIDDSTSASVTQGSLITLGGGYFGKGLYVSSADSGYAIYADTGYINVNTAYYVNEIPGLTINGHTGGILTDATAANAAEESRVQDLLVGWGLL